HAAGSADALLASELFRGWRGTAEAGRAKGRAAQRRDVRLPRRRAGDVRPVPVRQELLCLRLLRGDDRALDPQDGEAGDHASGNPPPGAPLPGPPRLCEDAEPAGHRSGGLVHIAVPGRDPGIWFQLARDPRVPGSECPHSRTEPGDDELFWALLQKPDADFGAMGADALAFMAAAVVEHEGEGARHGDEVGHLQLRAGIGEIAHEAVDHALLLVEDDLGALQRLLAQGDAPVAVAAL